MTIEQLISDLRAGTVPNATQQEILLVLAEAIKGLEERELDNNAMLQVLMDKALK